MIKVNRTVYADYDFYCSQYRGHPLHDYEFDLLAHEASIYIDTMTFDRLHSGWPSTDAVRYACCAIVEAIHQYDIRFKKGVPVEVKSENVDGYSVTYTDMSVLRKEAAMAKQEALDRYLPPTNPLRYAGGDR